MLGSVILYAHDGERTDLVPACGRRAWRIALRYRLWRDRRFDAVHQGSEDLQRCRGQLDRRRGHVRRHLGFGDGGRAVRQVGTEMHDRGGGGSLLGGHPSRLLLRNLAGGDAHGARAAGDERGLYGGGDADVSGGMSAAGSAWTRHRHLPAVSRHRARHGGGGRHPDCGNLWCGGCFARSGARRHQVASLARQLLVDHVPRRRAVRRGVFPEGVACLDGDEERLRLLFWTDV